MDKRIEDAIRRRATSRCEYCHLPEALSDLPHVLDHIIARQHHGETTGENLALCCGRCNLSKGPNLAGIDPNTGKITRLFHPRHDSWSTHFRWNGPLLVGATAIGRATIDVLAINHLYRITVRRVLQISGKFLME